jgi:hypothetical protein
VRVLTGSVVVAWVAADGSVGTQVVGAGQQYDARSGQLSPIPQLSQKEMSRAAQEARIAAPAAGKTFTPDRTIYYLSPTAPTSNGGGNQETPARPGL